MLFRSWTVSIHLPKKGVNGSEHHKRPDKTINITASSSHPDIPTVYVGEPWGETLSDARLLAESFRRTDSDKTVLQEATATTYEAAYDIVRANAARAGYKVPEDLTPDTARALLEDPQGLRHQRSWFDEYVAKPARQRLALGDALQLLDGATAEDPVAAINAASKAQQILTAPEVAAAIAPVRREMVAV